MQKMLPISKEEGSANSCKFKSDIHGQAAMKTMIKECITLQRSQTKILAAGLLAGALVLDAALIQAFSAEAIPNPRLRALRPSCFPG